ncbi:MAG: FtsW/RodA/SpoVE family cell cycle protein [Patescibacteria group bacterium]
MDYSKRRSKIRFNFDFWRDFYIIPVIFLISAIGIITAGSAIQTRTFIDNQSFGDEFFKQILSGFLLGVILAYGIYLIGIERIFQMKRILLITSLLTLLYLSLPSLISFVTKVDLFTAVSYFKNLPIRPVLRNAAVRWLSIGPFQFQPVELVKISLLVYIANFFKDLQNNQMTWDYYKRALYVFLVSCFFILIQPDLGSVVVITLMLATALFLLKLNIKQSLSVLGILGVFSTLAILVTPYRRERVLGWLSNSKLQNVDADYMQIQKVQEAVNRGGFFGVGYTKGALKQSIPEVSSDAVLAVLAEEFGFFMIFILIILYIIAFYYCIDMSYKSKEYKNKILLIGIGSWIFYQAMWNIAGVVGMVPLKGLPLPFISEGGTSVAVSLIGIGLVLTVIKAEKRI